MCTMEIEYRSAVIEDLPAIAAFVDFWLTGGGKAGGIPGAGHDFFVPVGRHEGYLKKYHVLLAGCAGAIVGWAVKTKKGVLIHLLVAATFRGRGIGSELLKRMSPDVVRSKFDQSSGDPAGFYRKHGYVKSSSERLGKKKNIDIFTKEQKPEVRSQKSESGQGERFERAGVFAESGHIPNQRSIDVMAEKLDLGTFQPARF